MAPRLQGEVQIDGETAESLDRHRYVCVVVLTISQSKYSDQSFQGLLTNVTRKKLEGEN
ncbi:hypothetical protein KC19_8G183200 [Ceratodon purpureus]|uniref:Uncharacterized protein n=1 Tax=Ceratodon purpureus TaxID=3225 RepID=A0A8T0H5B5_CERPU|nr:hypothetical protein KC19_8G183200 [Ceratodon purpureus]